MSNRYNKAPELTAEKAWKLYNKDGLSYRQIAERFSSENEEITHTTVRNRVVAFEDGKNEGVNEVTSNPKEYDLLDAIDDEPPEENPFDKVEMPCCGERAEKPNTPGQHSCPNCGALLNWSEDEI